MALIKYNNQSLSSITALPAAIPTGKLKLISSQTASNSASISFTTGLDSTYKVYRFVFVNIHASNEPVNFQFNGSTDSGSNYNVTKTSTHFETYSAEDNSGAGLLYQTGYDLAQSTAFLQLNDNTGNASDENMCGYLQLFNPSSTTYVKHFISTISDSTGDNFNTSDFVAGYFNTTSAINAIRFQMSSGNFSGTIYLYAIDNS